MWACLFLSTGWQSFLTQMNKCKMTSTVAYQGFFFNHCFHAQVMTKNVGQNESKLIFSEKEHFSWERVTLVLYWWWLILRILPFSQLMWWWSSHEFTAIDRLMIECCKVTEMTTQVKSQSDLLMWCTESTTLQIPDPETRWDGSNKISHCVDYSPRLCI